MPTDAEINVMNVAMAINGPWNIDAIETRERLMELRRIRWNMLSNGEKGERLCQARAAIAEYNP